MKNLYALILIFATATASAEVVVNKAPEIELGVTYDYSPPVNPAAESLDDHIPLLTDHPSTNDIPESGMMYKIDDGTNIVWWVCRQGDVIATQLSAHDSDGNAIISSIDLATDIETVIPIGGRESLRNAALSDFALNASVQADLNEYLAHTPQNVNDLFSSMTPAQKRYIRIERRLVKFLIRSQLDEAQP